MSVASIHCETCGDPLATPGLMGAHCPRCLFATAFGDPGVLDLPEEEIAPWTRLAGFELHEEIGRGGMGVVYRARQAGLDRTVAVKVLLHPKFASRGERERFQREARAAARLRHPGIVGIIDVGEDQSTPWYSMEHVTGKNLEQRIREAPPDVRQAAEWVRQVAMAVHHAHENGVLHRDLKPSNILLNEADDPLVADFGIARVSGEEGTDSVENGLTRTGQVLGSPGYAAPEQALGGEVDVRTDVYGLGALLYHLLVGRPPFQGLTVDAILLQLRDQDPPAPRKLSPAIPRDLETICLKCLRKTPSGRYSTAMAVASDLDAFLEGRSIEARPQGPVGKSWRWCRRRPASALMLFTIISLIAALIGGLLVVSQQQRRMDHRTALVSEARTLRQSRMAGGRDHALSLLAEAWRIQPSAEIRNEAIACLAMPEVSLVNDPSETEQSPDPTLSGDRSRSAIQEGDTIRVIDRAGTVVRQWPGFPAATLARLDTTGSRLATVEPGGKEMKIFSVDSGEMLIACPHPKAIDSLDWGNDLIATGCANRFIYIWDNQGILKHRLSGHQSDPVIVKFRPGGQELCSVSHDAYLRVWHAARGVELLFHRSNTLPLKQLWWTKEGTRLHARTQEGVTQTYDIQWSACMDLLAPPQEEPHSENLGSASFSRDGSLAAVIDEEVARLWDFSQGRVAGSIPKVDSQWLSTRFSPDGASVWICGWEHALAAHPISRDSSGRVRLGQPSPGLFGPGNLLRDGTPDGKLLMLSNNSVGEFVMVNPHTGATTHLSHPGTLATCISPDARWVMTSSHSTKGAKIWSVADGKHVKTLLPTETIIQGAPSPDGNRLLLHVSSGARAFRTQDWSEIPLPAGLRLRSLTFSPDGKYIASLGDNQIHLFDGRDLTPLAEIILPSQVGWLGEGDLRFNGTGRYLLLHTALGSVVRWNLDQTWAKLRDHGITSPLPH